MNIYRSFLECANRWIDRPAMEHQMEDGSVRKFDYRQTIAWVESYADELAKYGIKAGSRIAIIAEACPEWNVAYYAIAKFEATSVLIDPSLPQPELLRLIEFAEVDALIVNSGVYAKLTDLEKVTTAPVLDLMDGLKHLSGKVLEQPHATPGNPEVAFIIFSSGTTRVACGIMHGHDQIINTALSTIRSNGLNETDRYMAILPNSHIYGTLTQIFGPYLTGANVRFVQSLTAPALVQCFSEHHPTIIPGVPKLYELLENAARRKIASSAKTQKLFNFFFPICLNSCRTARLPSAAGLISTTVQSRRKAAVTADGADEYLTKIDEREIPITPITIMSIGCFSMYFITEPFIIVFPDTPCS